MNISLSGGFAGASPLLPSGPTAPGSAATGVGVPAEFDLLFASIEGAPATAADLSLSAPAEIATNADMPEDATLASSSLLAPGVSALVAKFMAAPAAGKSSSSAELPAGEATVLPDVIEDEQPLPQPELSSLPQTLVREHLPHIKTAPEPAPNEVVADEEQATGSDAEPASLPKPDVQQPIDRPAGPVVISQPGMQLGKPEVGQPIGHLQPEPIVSKHPLMKSDRGLTASFRPAVLSGATQQQLIPTPAATDAAPRVERAGSPQEADATLNGSAEVGSASFTSVTRTAAVATFGRPSIIDVPAAAVEVASLRPGLASHQSVATAAAVAEQPGVATDTGTSPAVSALVSEQRSATNSPAAALPEPLLSAEPSASAELTTPLPSALPLVSQVQQPAQSGVQAVLPIQDAAPAPRADEAVERQLDMLKEGEWLDRLARDITATAGRDGLLKFKLHPETLGSLHVEVARGQDGTSLRFTAENEAARAIIADAQPRLVAEARAQGLRLAETQVDLGGTGAQQQANDRRGSADTQAPVLRTAGAADTGRPEAGASQSVHSERFA